MAGGIGSRFWPLSKENKPKQFIDILGTGKSFIRQTYERFLGIVPPENFIVMTSVHYRMLVAAELPELAPEQIVCEPARRNTAPCIAYASYKIYAKDPDAVMIIAPSDHMVTNEREFESIIRTTADYAEKHNALMTIGIKPSRPETGYGYIQTEGNTRPGTILPVKTFTEKPNRELAEAFVQSGEFLWNSGIFAWSCRSILEAFEKYQPDINGIFAEGTELYNTPRETAFIENAYPMCSNISIDYGIMEKSHNVFVCGADFGWSDIGTWGSLYENSAKDKQHNSVKGSLTCCFNTQNSIIRIDNDKIAIIEGLDGYIVVCNDNALLICSRENEQEICSYLEEAKRNKGIQF